MIHSPSVLNIFIYIFTSFGTDFAPGQAELQLGPKHRHDHQIQGSSACLLGRTWSKNTHSLSLLAPCRTTLLGALPWLLPGCYNCLEGGITPVSSLSKNWSNCYQVIIKKCTIKYFEFSLQATNIMQLPIITAVDPCPLYRLRPPHF